MQHSNQGNFIFYKDGFREINKGSKLPFDFNNFAHAAYEGIRAYNTHNGPRLFKAKEHLLRLLHTCGVLGIAADIAIPETIDRIYDLLTKNRFRNAYIRVLVAQDASLFISAQEWNYFLSNRPMNLTVSSFQRPNPKSVPSDVKVVGYSIGGTLATKAAKEKGFDEALLLDLNGNLAQSSSANFFLEREGKLYTPPLGHVFPGITRNVVFQIANKLQLQIIEQELQLEDLKLADSAFICGTRTEITGVAKIDDHVFPEHWTNTLGATIQRIFINRVLEQENYEVII